jgi:hypothetical protein
MSNVFTAVGMIMPLLAVGAISTAPAASAAPHDEQSRQPDPLSCTLHADALGGPKSNRIKVEFNVNSIQEESRNFWKVEITHNGYRLVRDYMGTQHGRLSVWHMAGKTRGTDWFTATATNLVTQQQCRLKDAVRETR